MLRGRLVYYEVSKSTFKIQGEEQYQGQDEFKGHQQPQEGGQLGYEQKGSGLEVSTPMDDVARQSGFETLGQDETLPPEDGGFDDRDQKIEGSGQETQPELGATMESGGQDQFG